MYTKQEIIISSYRDGKSLRTIARELQISRKTVNKYIQEYEATLESSDCKETAGALFLSGNPVYKMTVPRGKLKLTNDVQEFIGKLLSKNKEKLEQGLQKQLMKKKDIHDALLDHGFDVGYTTLCNYIRLKEKQQSSKEAYIRQAYAPGDICEFDWGEIKLLIGGKRTSLQLAVFTSAYSNWRYAFIYNRQDTLAFMEAHTRFFEKIGGVYREMVYDNMRVAVARFAGNHEKEPTRALLELRGHYQFTHRFTNFYRGNEKGHVERSVEYVRRKAFAPKDDFNSAHEAQRWLDSTLERLNGVKQQGTGKSANMLLEEERRVLGKHPVSVMICSEQIQLRADKYATVSHQGNRYSVPDHLVGLFVDVSIRSREVYIFFENKRVAIHSRSYKPHDWVIDIEHYLGTFKKKPGAIAGSKALAGNNYLRDLYLNFFQDEPREFIELLSYCREQMVSEEKLEESVKRLLGTCGDNVTVERLLALIGNKHPVTPITETTDNIAIKAKEQLTWITQLMHQTNNNGQYKSANSRI
jgi:transposase